MTWQIKNKKLLEKHIIYIFSNNEDKEVELKYNLVDDSGEWKSITNMFNFSLNDKDKMVLLLINDLKESSK